MDDIQYKFLLSWGGACGGSVTNEPTDEPIPGFIKDNLRCQALEKNFRHLHCNTDGTMVGLITKNILKNRKKNHFIARYIEIKK